MAKSVEKKKMLLQEEKEKISSQAEIMFAKFPPRELFQYQILCYQNNGFIQQALCQLFGYNYSVFFSQVLYWYLEFFLKKKEVEKWFYTFNKLQQHLMQLKTRKF